MRYVRRLLASVRVRVTAAALLAVGCALAVSAVFVEGSLHHDRYNILMTTAQEQAREVVDLNQQLASPLELPPNPTLQTGLVQVLRNGKVVAASRPLHKEPPLWHDGDPTIQSNSYVFSGQAQDVHVVSVPVKVGRTPVHVVVVTSLGQYDHSISYVDRLLEIGMPVMLAIVGLIAWVIVGRALRPIEALRREVDEVATIPGSHRVPEPATKDEVGRLARTLNSMLDRIEASSSRERRFVSDASHELRSPIANIRTAIEVALHRPLGADWPSVGGEVLVQNERMARLVEELLMLARSDENRLLPVGEPTDLADVAESVTATFHGTKPEIVVSVESAPVSVPPGYLEHMVGNLVDNARRYANDRVEVTVGRRGRFAVLRVRDDGPGVSPTDRSRIFERFVRLDEARDRDGGGFGLGLAIVADLCRAYGGTIEVSDAGPGAAFTLVFPVARPTMRSRRRSPATVG